MSVVVDASIDCQLNGLPFQVCSEGNRLLITSADEKIGVELAQHQVPLPPGAPSSTTWRSLLRQMSIDVELREGAKTLVAIGPSSGVWWLKVVGQPDVYVAPSFLLRLFARAVFGKS